jgi:hypothetical protein
MISLPNLVRVMHLPAPYGFHSRDKLSETPNTWRKASSLTFFRTNVLGNIKLIGQTIWPPYATLLSYVNLQLSHDCQQGFLAYPTIRVAL